MDFTFAELLRSFRERASLAQAELASELAVHRNTISAWERGQYCPSEREMVLRLATELALTPMETDQLLRAADFPVEYGTATPLSTRYQLRPSVADFVGRTLEFDRLHTALRSAIAHGSGAVIGGIRGMGGIGKTELAYRLAHSLRDAFPDAQIVVELHGSSTASLTGEQALQAIIRTMSRDAKLPNDLPALQQLYRSTLHGRRTLILVDDADDATQVRPLIPPAGCALLITSRIRLILPGMVTVDLEHLSEDEAVTLLRGICARLSVAEAQAMAHACALLPLALRVSASILHNDPALAVTDYLQRLGDAHQRLSQLRDPDDPHLDVAASLTLSYARLDTEAQRVFRQLGVLVADFTTPLAVAVIEATPGVDVIQLLHRLLRRNLVLYDPHRARWRLHDLVRAMALRYLEEAGELEATTWRYAHAAVELAQAIGAQYLAGGDGIQASLTRFDTDRPHLEAARSWAKTHLGTQAGDTILLHEAIGMRNIALIRYDLRQDYIPHLEHARHAAQRLGDRQGEGHMLNNLGIAYRRLGDARRASGYHEQRLALARTLGDRRGEGVALINLGLAWADLGETDQAITNYEQARAIVHELADQHLESLILNNLGIVYADLGNAQQAILYFEQALILTQAIGNRSTESNTMNNLGQAYLEVGDIRRTIDLCTRSLAIARDINDRHYETYTLHNLGLASAALGNHREAITFYEEALTIARELEAQRGIVTAQYNLGRAAAELGDLQPAISLYRQALNLARAIEDRRSEAQILGHLGYAYATTGQPQQAIEAGEQALGIVRTCNNRRLEGIILHSQGRTFAVLGEPVRAMMAFEQALVHLQAVGDRLNESLCGWHFGLVLVEQGGRARALNLLRRCIDYEAAIGHTRTPQHKALLTRLEAGDHIHDLSQTVKIERIR
jgi:tetratricopeptide (TPR) repeat protein/DNA-binding XRE family transcriptional regulator